MMPRRFFQTSGIGTGLSTHPERTTSTDGLARKLGATVSDPFQGTGVARALRPCPDSAYFRRV
jgi:hypothetical protein